MMLLFEMTSCSALQVDNQTEMLGEEMRVDDVSDMCMVVTSPGSRVRLIMSLLRVRLLQQGSHAGEGGAGQSTPTMLSSACECTKASLPCIWLFLLGWQFPQRVAAPPSIPVKWSKVRI
jgi:hypothetical protein